MAGQERGVGATPLSSSAMPDLEPAAAGGPRSDPESSFRGLFEATYSRLVAYARRRSTDWAEADDVVAEVYAIAWRRHDDLAADAPPLPWLYGIAANVLRNQRRARTRRLHLVERLEGEPATGGHDPHGDAADEIRSALEQLSADDQEILRLVAWEGLSHAEAGQALGCSPNAVGIRIHRARTRLQAHLDDRSAPPDEGTTT